MTINHIDELPSIDVSRHEVRYWLRSLKHGFTEKLGSAYFRFPDRASVRSFQVSYRVSAKELPKALSGKLNFVLK